MSDRRQQILDASLPIFLAKGYAGTTISDIRKASGATTGSIYHFFAGKPGIAVALWREANASWSRKTGAARGTATPEEMVRSSVRGLLDWATGNQPMFLFFEELRIRAHSDPDLAPITEQIAQTHAEAADLYRDWARQGVVKPLPWTLASALMMGPAYDYLRKYRPGDDRDAAIVALVDAAWDAVRIAGETGS